MRILLIGGLGYVGGRLASHLHQQQLGEVHLSSVRRNFPAWSNQFVMHHLDLSDTASIQQCLNRARPDVIIQLGALQQADCADNPELAHKINVEGTARLVEQAKAQGIKRLIYFSTFQIYGDFVGHITEQTRPNPKSVYAQTKWEGEQVVSSAASRDFQTIVFRLSNAYGCPVDEQVADSVWTLAVNAFCRRAVTQGALLIKSNQYRDFIPMTDVVGATAYFLKDLCGAWRDGVYNLGGENCMSILQLAERVAANYERVIADRPLRIEGPTQDLDRVFEPFQYDIHQLRQAGYQLRGSMDLELQETLKFCRKLQEMTS